ncbi:hypothetical protein ACM42_08495 [Bradyrhizobium sp. CCBAU 25338]|nr:hypothetical protein [Bradyrhizobium sp. CCBAU 25338]
MNPGTWGARLAIDAAERHASHGGDFGYRCSLIAGLRQVRIVMTTVDMQDGDAPFVSSCGMQDYAIFGTRQHFAETDCRKMGAPVPARELIQLHAKTSPALGRRPVASIEARKVDRASVLKNRARPQRRSPTPSSYDDMVHQVAAQCIRFCAESLNPLCRMRKQEDARRLQ